MSDVLASALIGAPVYRMRAEIAYRELGSAAHRAVERLLAIGVPEPEIAALLGLRTEQVDVLGKELGGEHGQRVTELRVWIDPAHDGVLTSQEGLDLVPSSRYRDTPMLPVYPPAAGDLSTERFARAARARNPQHSRLVVDEVRSLTADTLPGTALQPGDRRSRDAADHVIFAADTYLLVRSFRGQPLIEVHDAELLDEELTAIARGTLWGQPGLSAERLTPAARAQAQESLYTTLAATRQEAYEVPLDPATVRDRLLTLIEESNDQLLVVAERPFKAWPGWLGDAYEEARRRGVRCVARDNVKPKGTEPPPRLPGCGIVAVRDDARALAHCDAHLIGGGWTLEALTGQACLEVHESSAVRRLLGRLEVEPPRPRVRPAPRSLRDIAAEEMRKALEDQRRDLPIDIPVAIEDSDMTAFVEQVERNGIRNDNLAKLKNVASGTVWERVLYATCCALAARRPELSVEDMRRAPPAGNIDLDVIVRNVEHRVWWVLDAKRATPSKDNERKMKLQLKTAAREGWIPEGFTARGLVVHPSDARFQPTTFDERVLRATLARLEAMLVSTIEQLDALE
jgi:hypothetical protein